MALPPGAFRALKRHPDALVHVLVASMAFASLRMGQPVATLCIVFLVLGFHFVTRHRAEQSETRRLELMVEAEVAKAEMVKARHVDLLTHGQASLPLRGPAHERLGKSGNA
jgi:hypothetical protein